MLRFWGRRFCIWNFGGAAVLRFFPATWSGIGEFAFFLERALLMPRGRHFRFAVWDVVRMHSERLLAECPTFSSRRLGYSPCIPFPRLHSSAFRWASVLFPLPGYRSPRARHFRFRPGPSVSLSGFRSHRGFHPAWVRLFPHCHDFPAPCACRAPSGAILLQILSPVAASLRSADAPGLPPTFLWLWTALALVKSQLPPTNFVLHAARAGRFRLPKRGHLRMLLDLPHTSPPPF